MEKVRFGIIGTGFIADAFAKDAKLVDTCDVVAVCSRETKSVEVFKKTHHIGKAYVDYDAMLQDDEIDAVYIATPHVFHKEHAISAMKAGKAVLCEKPFAMTSNDAKEMIDTARTEGVFLMEGMWTRFFPAYLKMKQLLKELGEINFIKSDFGFDMGPDYPKDGRLLNPELGGGALYDVGIYPISAVRDIMKCDPLEIKCTQMMTEDHVDLISTYSYMFKNGTIANLYSAINTNTEIELFISGAKGTIKMPKFFCPDTLIYTKSDGYQETYKYPKWGSGYTYEINAFCQSFLKGQLENEIMPLYESLAIMNLLDQISVKIGYHQF
jgi:predicted dehydrogenase